MVGPQTLIIIPDLYKVSKIDSKQTRSSRLRLPTTAFYAENMGIHFGCKSSFNIMFKAMLVVLDWSMHIGQEGRRTTDLKSVDCVQIIYKYERIGLSSFPHNKWPHQIRKLCIWRLQLSSWIDHHSFSRLNLFSQTTQTQCKRCRHYSNSPLHTRR